MGFVDSGTRNIDIDWVILIHKKYFKPFVLELLVERNIKLTYFLAFMFHGWFWMGNWIFYYLIFGGYATVALLDSGALLAGLIYEIPTGAFADLVGKKRTLILAFLFLTIGNVLMGLSNSLWMLAGSLWLFVCLAYAFYSGTMEAMLYDSLKLLKREKEFDKKMGSLSALRLLAMALSGVIGGVVFNFYPGLPYFLSGVLSFIGFIACFFLVEPWVDSEKYSLGTFFKQNTKGVKVLFGSVYMKKISWYLMVTGGFLVFIYNLLDDLLAVEYGFSPTTISWLFSVACLVAGVAAYLVPRMKVKISLNLALILPMLVIGFCLTLSPIVGMWASAVLLMIRVIGESVYQNYTSVALNENTPSKVRATTLSSLSLLRNIPYALFGTFVGGAVVWAGSAKNFALYYGLALLALTVFFGSRVVSENNNTQTCEDTPRRL